tara:strand:+ start:114 stop:635 length:522 start_codon:yes stop_codon:yes gene_type:complete
VYFKKLDLKLDIPSYEVGKRELEYGFDIDNKFNGLWYSNLKIDNEIDFIPERYKSDFYLQFLEANSYILPHSDSGVNTVINFYVETNNCVTQFYEIKDNAKPYQIDNQTDGHVYNLDDLVETDFFIAEPGDIYILDVSKVHSVIPLGDEQINRKAICFSTDKLNFTELVKVFT